MSIETLAATLETLAPRFTQPEIAGRGLRGMLLRLQTGADDTNPAIVGMTTAIENLGKKLLTPKEKLEMFGLENINVANTLITNVEELKHYEKALTGTNVAIEQAAINTDNNNSKLAQARNRLNVMSIELGEKLAPALQVSTNGLTYFIKALTISIGFISKHKVLILTLIYSLTAYALATKLATMWEARKNKETLYGTVIGWLQSAAYTAQFAAISLYNAGIALLSGNLAVATIQFRAFSAAMAANPIGLFVGLIVAAGTALYFYSAKLTDAQKAQRMLSDLNLSAKNSIVEEKLRIRQLLALAREELASKEARLDAIRKLQDIAPGYLGSITLETINTNNTTDAIGRYLSALEKKAKVQAAMEQLIDVEKELNSLEAGKGYEASFWQATKAFIRADGMWMGYKRNMNEYRNQNFTDKEDQLLKKKKQLLEITKQQVDLENSYDPNDGGDSEQDIAMATDLVRAKELELEVANHPKRNRPLK